MKGELYVLAIGDLVADIIVQVPEFPIKSNDFLVTDELFMEAGGSCNFLITVSRLGLKACALGTVGNDMWGKRIDEILKEEEVDTRQIQRNGESTVVVSLSDRKGEHTFLGKYGNGKNPQYSEKQKELVRQAGAVFGSGYSLADPSRGEFTLAAFNTAKEYSIPVYFDPGPVFPGLDEELRAGVLKLADCVFLTEEEAAADSYCHPKNLLQAGVETVVVKRGASGSKLFYRDVQFDQAGLPAQKKDTSAAGDCYDAAFVVGCLKGWPPAECASFANVVGAAKIKKLGGGRQVPSLDEIRTTAAEFDIDIRI